LEGANRVRQREHSICGARQAVTIFHLRDEHRLHRKAGVNTKLTGRWPRPTRSTVVETRRSAQMGSRWSCTTSMSVRMGLARSNPSLASESDRPDLQTFTVVCGNRICGGAATLSNARRPKRCGFGFLFDVADAANILPRFVE
jgi:hypothetical protein